MFLKQKQDGKIKVQTVAGGNKQRTYIPEEAARLVTVATESVLLTSIVDTEENSDITVIDISNAFIQMRIKEYNYITIIKIREVLVDILC